eukprot:231750-Chlamydomonas_euryale.AAC.5
MQQSDVSLGLSLHCECWRIYAKLEAAVFPGRLHTFSSEPHSATTVRAPPSSAICTARWPVPPAAAETATASPAANRAVVSSATHAVTPDSTSATASALGGPSKRTSDAARAIVYSAKQNSPPPRATAWPSARSCGQPGPSATTTPAPSAPSGKCVRALLAANACSPRARNVSQPPLIPAKRTRTSASPGPGRSAQQVVCGVSVGMEGVHWQAALQSKDRARNI